ncbi:MAG: prepilin peptidase [Nanoarchaeota archaeon]|nr:prepilin peptidase [Nanoarchaeota archaeon]
MLIEISLVIITIIFLAISSISDLKTREVPDYLSYSLMAIASTFIILKAITSNNYKIILNSFIIFIIFLIISLIMYYSKQWGGGDSKILMSLGIIFYAYPESLLNYFNPNLVIPFPLTLIINILLFGSIYGLIYSFVLLKKSKKQFKPKINKLFYIPPIILILITFVVEDIFKLLILFLASLSLIYPYLLGYIRFIEKTCMLKLIPVNKLTEGDWIVKDIKNIYKKTSLGVTKEQIEKLKKLKIKKVLVRYGIPFIPSFLIAVIISIIFGNILPF